MKQLTALFAAVLLLAAVPIASCGTTAYEPKTAEEAVLLQQQQLAQAQAWTQLAATVAWTVSDIAHGASRNARSGEPCVETASGTVLGARCSVVKAEDGYAGVAEGATSWAQGPPRATLEEARADAARLAASTRPGG